MDHVRAIGRAYTSDHDWSGWNPVEGGYVHEISKDCKVRAEVKPMERKAGKTYLIVGNAEYVVTEVRWHYGVTLRLATKPEISVSVYPEDEYHTHVGWECD